MSSIYIKKFLDNHDIKLVHLAKVSSTMSEIKKYIGKKNVCMIVNEQSQGIGRRGNEWISPKGNIYLSFLFEFNLAIEKHFLYTAVSANSICTCLNSYINENINIKWPNDINVNNCKIAGIMTEIINFNNLKYAIIGIGINISTSPKIINYKTCCLNDFNLKIKHEEFLLSFLKAFFSEYDMILKKEYNEIINKFRNKMKDLGNKITILLPNGKKEYVLLKNLNFDGSLQIEKAGKQKSIYSARIIDDFN